MTTLVKPSFVRATMTDVRERRGTNGYRVVSTFSGCGGSCLGFELAGFEIVWANEFIQSAAEVYALNHPHVPLDSRDVRKIAPGDILRAVECHCGAREVDVLEGSPPCASFSTAGRRHHTWGEVRKYSETKQRVDDLFWEFARLVDGVRPRVFVAENVSGLIKGVAKGYFKEILRRLRSCGYAVEARVLDAQWLGVPQARQRLMFVGVRDDLVERGALPAFPTPLPYRYTIEEVLPHVRALQLGGAPDRWDSVDRPAGTIVQSGASIGPTGYFSATQVEARSDITAEDVDAWLADTHAVRDEYDRLALGDRSSRYYQLERCDPARPSATIQARHGHPSCSGPCHPYERRKWYIGELKVLCGFPHDFTLTGTYEQQWERLGRAVPPPMMRAVAETIRDEILRPLVSSA